MFPLGSVWELMLSLHAIRVFRVIERYSGKSMPFCVWKSCYDEYDTLGCFHMRGVSSPHNWLNTFLRSCFCRHLGSAKFGSFLFLAAVLSKSIELALCVQFPFLRPPLGPLAILSAVAMTYYGERRGVAVPCIAVAGIVNNTLYRRGIPRNSVNPVFFVLPASPPGYIPSMAPAYFTVGNVRVTEKLFAYAAVVVVSGAPFRCVGALLGYNSLQPCTI